MEARNNTVWGVGLSVSVLVSVCVSVCVRDVMGVFVCDVVFVCL